jgi:hypothetical protein
MQKSIPRKMMKLSRFASGSYNESNRMYKIKSSTTYNEGKDAVIKAKTALSRFVGTYDRAQTT